MCNNTVSSLGPKGRKSKTPIFPAEPLNTSWTLRLKLDYYSGNNETDNLYLTRIYLVRTYIYQYIYLDSIL